MAKNSDTINHLILLRRSLISSLIAFAVLFAILFSCSHYLYQYLAMPLMQKLPNGSQLIATTLTAPILVPIKLSIYGSLFLAVPFMFYQFWRFIAPGLYQTEKRFMLYSFLATLFLFYLGLAFCYYLILPLIYNFLMSIVPGYIKVLPDMAHYLGFVLKLLFAFGIAFEMPMAVIILTISGIVSLDKLRSWRPYVIIGAFVLGMLLTPPDVVSQILLAVPLWLLYEIGLLLSKFLKKSFKNRFFYNKHSS